MTDRTGSRGPLRVRVENGVAWIVLDRPAARNALSVDLVRRLRRAMQEVDADPVVDVVVLTGSGTTFCAGLDFRELVSSPAEMLTELSAVPGCPWVPISKPVVGAINGPAVSGGLELALHCDFLVASAGAGFADTHALVGGVPGWGLTARLPAQIGFAAARRMSLTGEMLDAAEALRRGLITEVVSAEDLVPRVTEIAQSTRRGQPEARGRVLSGYRDAENVVAQVQRRSERAHFEGWVESRGGFLVEIDRASVARVRERKEELVRTSESTRPDLPIDALVPLRDLRTVGRVVRELDELSYERVLFPESTHDVFTTIAAAAQHSGEMTLASAVAVAFARNPMTVAYVAWDLQEITGGRFVLGLGSQVRGHIVRRYGMPWSSPAERMREFVSALRAIWGAWQEERPLEYAGRFYQHNLMPPTFVPRTAQELRQPRISLAGVGPRMVELAGGMADEFLAHPFNTADTLRESVLPALQRGAERFERSDPPVEVTCQFIGIMGETEQQIEASRLAARQQIAFYASTPAYAHLLASMGLTDLHERLNELSRNDAWAQMADLVEDELLDQFCVSGDAVGVRAEVEARCRGLAHRAVVMQAVSGFPSDDSVLAWHRALVQQD